MKAWARAAGKLARYEHIGWNEWPQRRCWSFHSGAIPIAGSSAGWSARDREQAGTRATRVSSSTPRSEGRGAYHGGFGPNSGHVDRDRRPQYARSRTRGCVRNRAAASGGHGGVDSGPSRPPADARARPHRPDRFRRRGHPGSCLARRTASVALRRAAPLVAALAQSADGCSRRPSSSTSSSPPRRGS